MYKRKGSSKMWLLLYLNDLRWGIRAQWKRYVLFAFFCFTASLFLWSQIQGNNTHQDMTLKGTLADYLLNFFHGMESYEPSSQTKFNIPIIYMGIFIFISFIIGNYTMNDLSHRGIQIVIRCQSRYQWIFSKILWNLTAVCAAYMIVLLISVLFGGNSTELTAEIADRMMHFNNVKESGLSDNMLLLRMFGMSILVSISVAQLQMAISLLLSPVIAYFIVIAGAFLSAYMTSPYLIGNYYMLQRSSMFLDDGVNYITGIIICVLILAVSIWMDFVVIKHKNIL